jgi:aspartyl-tRNA(Asn)/glutamyl-tRNA(Gln) amidotransferase subunit C
MITHEELKKIAALAKLSLADVDADALLRDIGGIIDFADEVAGADLTGLDVSETPEVFPLREDVVKPSLPQEIILKNAGETRDGLFVARERGGLA